LKFTGRIVVLKSGAGGEAEKCGARLTATAVSVPSGAT
jgi:hypothetical protein